MAFGRKVLEPPPARRREGTPASIIGLEDMDWLDRLASSLPLSQSLSLPQTQASQLRNLESNSELEAANVRETVPERPLSLPEQSKILSPSILPIQASELSNLEMEAAAVRETALKRPSPRPEQPAIPLPSSPGSPCPEHPVHTSFQTEALSALRWGSAWGLTMQVYRYCKAKVESGKRDGFQPIVDDIESGRWYTFILLSSHPSYVLESFIRNTLTFDYYHQPQVRWWVDHELETSQDCAGVYLQCWTQSQREPHEHCIGQLPDANSDVGCFISPRQVESLADTIETYYHIESDESTLLANKLHGAMSLSALQEDQSHIDKNWRRYKATKWKNALVTALREMYVEGVSIEDLDHPHHRTLMEVGQTYDMQSRLAAHRAQRSDNAAFGLCGAIFRAEDCIRPLLQWAMEHGQYVMFHVWNYDEDFVLMSVAEVLGTVLASSYVEEGGCNAHPAGRRAVRNEAKVTASPVWARGKARVFGRRILLENLAFSEASVASRRKLYQVTGSIDAE